MPAIQNTASLPDLLVLTFGLTWKGNWEIPMEASQVVKETDTKQKVFSTTSVHGPGSPKPLGEGDDIASDVLVPGFQFDYTQQGFGLKLLITEEMMLYDLTGIIRSGMELLHRSMRNFSETRIADLLNSAFAATRIGGDGVSLCSTAHVLEAGGTWANRPAIASSLSVASYRDALIDFQDQRDAQNFFLGVKAEKLIVPAALEYRAREILRSGTRPDTTVRADNVTQNETSMFVYHYLTSATAWFLSNQKHTVQCKWSQRPDQTSEKKNGNRNTEHTSVQRFALGWDDARFFWGNPGI